MRVGAVWTVDEAQWCWWWWWLAVVVAAAPVKTKLMVVVAGLRFESTSFALRRMCSVQRARALTQTLRTLCQSCHHVRSQHEILKPSLVCEGRIQTNLVDKPFLLDFCPGDPNHRACSSASS